ncbi:hypothetical protein ACFX1S_010181 [Malus domestica]
MKASLHTSFDVSTSAIRVNWNPNKAPSTAFLLIFIPSRSLSDNLSLEPNLAPNSSRSHFSSLSAMENPRKTFPEFSLPDPPYTHPALPSSPLRSPRRRALPGDHHFARLYLLLIPSSNPSHPPDYTYALSFTPTGREHRDNLADLLFRGGQDPPRSAAQSHQKPPFEALKD